MRTPFHPMLVTALLAGAALSASAQTQNMNVNISGLCEFSALSWSMQENQQQNGTTTVTVSASKTVDVCSPLIYRAVVTGQRYSSVTFAPASAPNVPQPAMLTLQGVLIAQTQLNDAASAGLPTETVSFLFESFTTQESTASATDPGNTSLNLRDLGCTAVVTGWSIGAASSATSAVPAGTATAPTLSTLQVTKPFNGCSQQIVQAITTGRSLTQVVLTQKDPATGYTLTITLNGGSKPRSEITSYQVSGAANSGTPLETIQISYTEITFAIQFNPPNGGAESNSIVTWNQATQSQ